MTTTELARSFMDDLDQLPAEIPGAANLEPGRVSWLHGVNSGGARTAGVFYAKETAFVDAPKLPWMPDERYENELGYSTPQLNIAIIAERSQWFMPGESVGDQTSWLNEYQPGAKKLTEYLIRIQGIAEPMVLSVSGLYKARPIADIISDYRRNTLAQAMRKAHRSLPLWSFWLPIANKTRDGKTEYLKAVDSSGKEHGSTVTPPALAATPIPRTAAELVADSELWKEFKERGWMSFKRLERNTVEADYTIEVSVPQLAAAPEHRNIPQALLEDDELPF